jgi:hypothetical protein
VQLRTARDDSCPRAALSPRPCSTHGRCERRAGRPGDAGGRRAAQVFAQVKYFIPDPIANDVAYQARAQPFLVFGLLTTGLAIGHHNAAAMGL